MDGGGSRGGVLVVGGRRGWWLRKTDKREILRTKKISRRNRESPSDKKNISIQPIWSPSWHEISESRSAPVPIRRRRTVVPFQSFPQQTSYNNVNDILLPSYMELLNDILDISFSPATWSS